MMDGREPEPAEEEDREISLFEIASILLRNRWRILRWIVLGGALAVIPVLFEGRTYTASASFVPQGRAENGRSGLANLAGQFGLMVGAGEATTESPQFYAKLLKSRVVLEPIASAEYSVAGMPGKQPFLDLMGIAGATQAQRVERGVAVLADMISTAVDRETGVLSVSVRSPWPQLSLEIARRLVAGVNHFNLQTRQTQASHERQFAQSRLEEARASLRKAENRVQDFLQANHAFQSSPELSFAHDRLQRQVEFQQQVVTSLMQSYEDARLREVRNTPVITVIEQPAVVSHPNSRGGVKRGLMGVFLGAVFGAFLALGSRMIERRRSEGDPDVEAFFATAGEVRRNMFRYLPTRSRQQKKIH